MCDALETARAARTGGEMSEPPKIASVYSFSNGQTMVFDQHGQQMPEFQGRTSDVMPKIRAAGFTGEIVKAVFVSPSRA
jgi:hypothetical protein